MADRDQFGIPAGNYRQFDFTEHLAQWMLRNSFSTGHGDDFASLLDELEWQVAELRARRERPVCDPTAHDWSGWRELPNGNGEQVCGRCGIGALSWKAS